MAKTKTPVKKKDKKLKVIHEIRGNFGGSSLTMVLEVSPQPAMCTVCKTAINAREPRVRVIARVPTVLVTKTGFQINKSEMKLHRRCLRKFMDPQHAAFATQCYHCTKPIDLGKEIHRFHKGRFAYYLCCECEERKVLKIEECVQCKNRFAMSELSPVSREPSGNMWAREDLVVGALCCNTCQINFGAETIRSQRADERLYQGFYEEVRKAREQLKELVRGEEEIHRRKNLVGESSVLGERGGIARIPVASL